MPVIELFFYKMSFICTVAITSQNIVYLFLVELLLGRLLHKVSCRKCRYDFKNFTG